MSHANISHIVYFKSVELDGACNAINSTMIDTIRWNNIFKWTFYPKRKNSVIIHSPACPSKTLCCYFFHGTNKSIFGGCKTHHKSSLYICLWSHMVVFFQGTDVNLSLSVAHICIHKKCGCHYWCQKNWWPSEDLEYSVWVFHVLYGAWRLGVTIHCC